MPSLCFSATIKINGGGTATIVINNGGTKTAKIYATPPSAAAGGCAAPGTASSFRAVSNDIGATQTNDTVNKPAGTVDNDVMLAYCHLESNTPDLAAPAGWTLALSTTNVASTPDSTSYTYWKRASSEGASYIFTHANAFSECAIITYANVNTACGPIDTNGSTNTFTTATTWTGKSITTNYTNNMLVLEEDNFDGNTGTLPASPAFTSRLSTVNLIIGEFKQAASGPSGDVSGTIGAATGGVCFTSLID